MACQVAPSAGSGVSTINQLTCGNDDFMARTSSQKCLQFHLHKSWCYRHKYAGESTCTKDGCLGKPERLGVYQCTSIIKPRPLACSSLRPLACSSLTKPAPSRAVLHHPTYTSVCEGAGSDEHVHYNPELPANKLKITAHFHVHQTHNIHSCSWRRWARPWSSLNWKSPRTKVKNVW